jgi:hypothetical protein
VVDDSARCRQSHNTNIINILKTWKL